MPTSCIKMSINLSRRHSSTSHLHVTRRRAFFIQLLLLNFSSFSASEYFDLPLNSPIRLISNKIICHRGSSSSDDLFTATLNIDKKRIMKFFIRSQKANTQNKYFFVSYAVCADRTQGKRCTKYAFCPTTFTTKFT